MFLKNDSLDHKNVFFGRLMLGIVYSNPDTKMTQIGNLKYARMKHSCGLFWSTNEYKIVVAGGFDGLYSTSSVEMLDVSYGIHGAWISMDPLPFALHGSSMVNIFNQSKNELHLIGGKSVGNGIRGSLNSHLVYNGTYWFKHNNNLIERRADFVLIYKLSLI